MAERKVAFFDIDQTIYNGYILRPLTQLQCETGIISKECLDAVLLDIEKNRMGELDYETFAYQLLVDWGQGLRGIPYVGVLDQTITFLRGEEKSFFPHTLPLIKLLHSTHDMYLVTGEPQFVGEAVKELLGVSGHISSEFEIVDGKFTGKVKRPLARREEKSGAIAHFFNIHPWSGSIAFGDSMGDAAMLDLVEHPVLLPSGEPIKTYGQERGWHVIEPEMLIPLVPTLLTQPTLLCSSQ